MILPTFLEEMEEETGVYGDEETWLELFESGWMEKRWVKLCIDAKKALRTWRL